MAKGFRENFEQPKLFLEFNLMENRPDWFFIGNQREAMVVIGALGAAGRTKRFVDSIRGERMSAP